MRRRGLWTAWLATALAGCGGTSGKPVPVPSLRPTTSGAIAVANLDDQIARRGDEPGVEELLLLRARFLADDEALDRAVASTERRFETGRDLLRRAQVRSAAHRFAEALADLEEAERTGAEREAVGVLRASILVASGRGSEVISQLETGVARHPGFALRSALAGAYAAVGRRPEADRLYVAALADLDTTSPFPYAWIEFARGGMWSEPGGDSIRAEAAFARALTYLPKFVGASVHLAALEAERGDLDSARKRLERVVASTEEPEALALLGELHRATGDPLRGRQEIALARRRYESLLARYPLAFADHAAEFYLGPGTDPQRAWVLARRNLAARRTDRAVALELRAARASGHAGETLVPGAKIGASSP
jgi:tetratricopeptide (TPR) repeat protein